MLRTANCRTAPRRPASSGTSRWAGTAVACSVAPRLPYRCRRAVFLCLAAAIAWSQAAHRGAAGDARIRAGKPGARRLRALRPASGDDPRQFRRRCQSRICRRRPVRRGHRHRRNVCGRSSAAAGDPARDNGAGVLRHQHACPSGSCLRQRGVRRRSSRIHRPCPPCRCDAAARPELPQRAAAGSWRRRAAERDRHADALDRDHRRARPGRASPEPACLADRAHRHRSHGLRSGEPNAVARRSAVRRSRAGPRRQPARFPGRARRTQGGPRGPRHSRAWSRARLAGGDCAGRALPQPPSGRCARGDQGKAHAGRDAGDRRRASANNGCCSTSFTGATSPRPTPSSSGTTERRGVYCRHVPPTETDGRSTEAADGGRHDSSLHPA